MLIFFSFCLFRLVRNLTRHNLGELTNRVGLAARIPRARSGGVEPRWAR